MAKAKKGVPTTPPAALTPTPPPTRRTDTALLPATPLDVIVSRALDQELGWFFAYPEGALHRESVGMLPSYAAVRILADGTSAALPRRGQDLGEPTDEACRGRALDLAHEKRVPVAELRSRAQGPLGRAVVAYANARSLESAAMGVT